MQPKQSHPAAFFLWRLGERQILARLGHWVVVQDARRGFATENGGTCESRTQLFQPFDGRSTYDLKVWRPESHEARNSNVKRFDCPRPSRREGLSACRSCTYQKLESPLRTQLDSRNYCSTKAGMSKSTNSTNRWIRGPNDNYNLTMLGTHKPLSRIV